VQVAARRASAATIAGAIETARLHEDLVGRARQLQIVNEVSQAIATSIDLDQTLSLVARNMARTIDASICLIALLDEDGSAWHGAAASDMEDVWLHRRVERPERSIVFDCADLGRPIVADDAEDHELVSPHMARLLRIQSLVALPLQTPEGAIGAVVLGQRDRKRIFTPEEIERATGLANQAAVAIRNARLHAREEEEQHIQKDVILIGFGQWGQKAYKHLVLLKSFFNFRIHVVERDSPGRREVLADAVDSVLSNGDLFYWDSPDSPALTALSAELEPSCYVITYIATPAETHLPVLKLYYDLSNVVLIEKPLGAPPEQYREFLDRADGTVQIVAADHYWFKMEVRLLDLLLTEERNLRSFLDEIEEVEIEILEAQPPSGSGAQIGMIADLIPHAFAILSLLTPLDRLKLAPDTPLQIGRFEPLSSEHETYARLMGSFDHRGRSVRVVIDVGKGVTNAKWIKLTGPRRMGGRRSFYKFDFVDGVAMDGTQGALRAAVRPIRQPGVPDNAHLNMLRHVIEKKHPAVGVLSIHEALRANARVRELERMAAELMAAGKWAPYTEGQRPQFLSDEPVRLPEAGEKADVTEPSQLRR
jgi:GAF domain-containing protein